MNSSLLTVDEADGFEPGFIVKCVAHPDPSEIGEYSRITGFPEICTAVLYDSDDEIIEGSQREYYGQDVESLDGKRVGFYALSWMRPATPEEIAAL